MSCVSFATMSGCAAATHYRFKFMLRELLQLARKELPVSPLSRWTGICGWSMEGYTAFRFAVAFPEEVHSITVGLLAPLRRTIRPTQGEITTPPGWQGVSKCDFFASA
jgi:hypothetical protein